VSLESRQENVRNIAEHYEYVADVFGREESYRGNAWMSPAPIMNIGYWERGATSARQAQEDFVHFAASRLGPLEGRHVLDAGCGLAGPASILAHDYGAQIDGITIVPRQIEWAQRFLAAHQLDDRVRVHLGSAMDMPFADETFDIVLSLEAAHCFADKSRFLAEASRVLRPGGTLLVIDLIATRPELIFCWQPALKLRLITARQWETLLSSAGFRIEESQLIGRQIYPGYRRWLLLTAAERRDKLFKRICPDETNGLVRSGARIRAWATEFALCRSVLPLASRVGLREYGLFLARKSRAA